jgi:diketogulonate reductase-like aldo/keto reductase
MDSRIPGVKLSSGSVVPALGQGTWYMGQDRRSRLQEINALRLGVDLGMTLIDTAEMYADGGAEEVVGEALAGQRDSVFIVSKVLPSNASARGTIEACERSLRRLQTDIIDLYLLHWRSHVGLEETVTAFDRLIAAGKIKNWGVSNFDMDDMDELVSVDGGAAVAVNQILYNLQRRGPELELMPWCLERDIPIMAYSPIEQGRLLRHSTLVEIGIEWETSPAVIALAWVLMHEKVIAIPKSSNPQHVRENRRAADITLTSDQLARIERAFRSPAHKVPLEML